MWENIEKNNAAAYSKQSGQALLCPGPNATLPRHPNPTIKAIRLLSQEIKYKRKLVNPREVLPSHDCEDGRLKPAWSPSAGALFEQVEKGYV